MSVVRQLGEWHFVSFWDPVIGAFGGYVWRFVGEGSKEYLRLIDGEFTLTRVERTARMQPVFTSETANSSLLAVLGRLFLEAAGEPPDKDALERARAEGRVMELEKIRDRVIEQFLVRP